MFVPRTCTQQSTADEQDANKAQKSVSLESLRNLYAFALLGDPGAGKSTAFIEEAKAIGSVPISARDFITFDQKQEDWINKTIFIDGLDETRAGGSDGRTMLDKIRTKLEQLDHPRFRISCRAADWLGQSDAANLAKLVKDNHAFGVYQLDDLTDNDILQILRENYGITNPDSFVQKAEEHRLTDLLRNPQTLEMLAKAVGTKNSWPASRLETYQLACAKLVTEHNSEHIVAKKKKQPDENSLLLAAGYLSCLSLIADVKELSQFSTENADALYLDVIPNPDKLPLPECIETKLFKSTGNNSFTPVHRTVAEYLAANFIAEKIKGDLSLSRALALMCGADGGVVTELRGLHAWLAACSSTARKKLIDNDPLGVLLYGDAKGFSVTEKKWVLDALHRAATFFPSFRWQDWNAQPFAALITEDMADELERILKSTPINQADQVLGECVVEAIRYGDVVPQLGAVLIDIVSSTRWVDEVRQAALAAYLKKYLTNANTAIKLLGDIRIGNIKDDDDQLEGILLYELYPTHISTNIVIKHLHLPKRENYFGRYKIFWCQNLLDKTNDDLLSDLMEAFKVVPEVVRNNLRDQYWIPAGILLVRTLKMLGDKVTDKKMFDWLTICIDEHNDSQLDGACLLRVQAWFATRPERYKGVLRISLDSFADTKYFTWPAVSRLHGAPPPNDIGSWWVEQSLKEADQQLAESYFRNAIRIDLEGKLQGGVTLEQLEEWSTQRTGFRKVLSDALTCDLTHHEWRLKDAIRKREYDNIKKERIEQYRVILPELRGNRAHPQTLHELSGVCLGRYLEAQGDTPIARLNNFFDNDAELVPAVLEALKNSIYRSDLPSVKQLITSDQKGKMFYITQALLVGMELVYQTEPEKFQSLKDDVLLFAIVGRYIDGTGNEPNWFEHLVSARPDLVSQACIVYTQGRLKSRKEYVHGTYALAHNEQYAEIAKRSVPVLLVDFPNRVGIKQLNTLEYLLIAAIQYWAPEKLSRLIAKKLKSKLDVGQRVYWLATGLIIKPDLFHSKLANYVKNNQIRSGHLGLFLYGGISKTDIANEFSAGSLALLIELIGPDCRPERLEGGGLVTSGMDRAYLVRNWINLLSSKPETTVADELLRLENLPELQHWASQLRHARLAQKIVSRDNNFIHPDFQQVAATLYKGKPTNAADIAAIVNDVLAELADEMQRSNANIYKQFWNTNSPHEPKHESDCRGVMQFLLEERLRKYSIKCQPEALHVHENRSDILCVHGQWAIPIEIKKDKNKKLWKTIQEQLVPRYTIDPRAQGFGIYLVLWFGGGKDMPPPLSGRKPVTADELKHRLEEQINAEKQRLISVHVFDCSYK